MQLLHTFGLLSFLNRTSCDLFLMEPPSDHSSSPTLPREVRSIPLRTIAPVTALVLVLFALRLGISANPAIAGVAALTAIPAVIAALMVRKRGRRLAMAGILLSISNVLGCLLAVWLIGSTALAWVYLVLMANFFIVRSQIAIVANLTLSGALLVMPGILLGTPVNIPGMAVIVLTMAFGYRFSRRVLGDRARLELLASLDTLTGLPNRRMLEKTLVQLIGDARNDRFQHALVVLDIDHFKAVNDRFGHNAGDTALSDLSMILRFELRENDKVFRFGGEEFVILVNARSREALESFTERMRKAVYQSLRGPGGRITISLGAAMYNGEPHWQDWFSRADAALYRAKAGGRDNYMIAEDLG